MKSMSSLSLDRVYFDCNATTPVIQESLDSALLCMKKIYGNPSSSHMTGAEAKISLERSRNLAAELINAKPTEIFFTSGATEAIQLSILSVLQNISLMKNDLNFRLNKKVLVVSTEHKAVLNSIEHWKNILNLDIQIEVINVNKKGKIQFEEFKEKIKNSLFVCTMAVNNETGVIHDLKHLEKIIRAQQQYVYWLVDCVQAIGKIKLDFDDISVDYATFSGHKIYSPKGVGFLYLRKNSPRCPLIVGGGQEQGLRSGTENLPGISAMAAVLEKLNKQKNGKNVDVFRNSEELIIYRNKLVNSLINVFPNIEFNTDFKNSVSTTINFSVYGVSSKELMNVFDSAGLSVSGGSACNSGTSSGSHVLKAMNLPLWQQENAIRLSFGLATTHEEIEFAVKAIRNAGMALKKSCFNLYCHEKSEAFISDVKLHGVVQLLKNNAYTWILIDKDTLCCIVIDITEENLQRTVDIIQCQNLNIQYVLDTHSHADHISARKKLFQALKFNDNSCHPLGWMTDDDDLNFNSKHWIVKKIEIPGHTLDSVCYLVFFKSNQNIPVLAFVGDTILCGGLGRTDFEISGIKHFYNSLHKLNKILKDTTLICPSHDYGNCIVTTWGIEKTHNNLINKALNTLNLFSLEDFCFEKEKLDSLITCTTEHGSLVCGKIDNENLHESDEMPLISIEKVSTQEFEIIDVRDRAEAMIFGDWKRFGISKVPINVPLSEMTQFICDILNNKYSFDNKRVLLICSTGSRSLAIAKIFRKLNFNNVWSIIGGSVFLK